ncbi:MAG: thiol peroxidase [Planctomycetota bacterium]|nr:thiol peroxidase [Planctomycetota bacterium]
MAGNEAGKRRSGLVTLKGNPVVLVGDEVKVGDRAPDFEALGGDLKPVRLSDFRGKVVVLVSVPSLDTPVCDVEAKKFNEAAAKLGGDAAVLVLSMDLPFAQKRWCAATGASNVRMLSDHRKAEFGLAYGVLIEDLRLLARAVFVVGRDGMVKHAQIVKETASEPDYESVLAAAREAAGGARR